MVRSVIYEVPNLRGIDTSQRDLPSHMHMREFYEVPYLRGIDTRITDFSYSSLSVFYEVPNLRGIDTVKYRVHKLFSH